MRTQCGDSQHLGSPQAEQAVDASQPKHAQGPAEGAERGQAQGLLAGLHVHKRPRSAC